MRDRVCWFKVFALSCSLLLGATHSLVAAHSKDRHTLEAYQKQAQENKRTTKYLKEIKSASAKEVFDLVGPLQTDEYRPLWDDLLASYMLLFKHFPRAFDPYNQWAITPAKTLSLVRGHLCGGQFSVLCKKYAKPLKEMLRDHLERTGLDKAQRSLESMSFRRNQSLAKLRVAFDHERELFSQYHRRVASSIKLLNRNKEPRSAESMNRHLESVWTKQLASHIDSYRQELARRASTYPGRLLLSEHLQRLIEGGHYQLDYADIVIAIADVTKTLKRQFLARARALTLSEPEDKGFESSFWAQKKLRALPPIAAYSKLRVPFVDQGEYLATIQPFHCDDATTFMYLQNRDYQRAIWHLRRSGSFSCAESLEAHILSEVLSPETYIKMAPLGAGFTTSYFSLYQRGQRGVYKPLPANPIRRIAANIKNEVAAFKVDRLLELNMVPMTRSTTIADYKVGSEQFFVKDTTSARDMSDYNGVRPGKLLWVSSPRERVAKSQNMKFYDWLISNSDRNIENYLLSYDGSEVLIDHGFTFRHKHFVRHPSDSKLRVMIPSRAIYARLQELAKDPTPIETELSPWLSRRIRKLMKKQISYFVKKVDKLIQNEGYDKIFAQADKEDRRPFRW